MGGLTMIQEAIDHIDSRLADKMANLKAVELALTLNRALSLQGAENARAKFVVVENTCPDGRRAFSVTPHRLDEDPSDSNAVAVFRCGTD